MYKTVRKGDASLQYTILPQNEQSGTVSAPSVPKKKARVTKYVITLVIVLTVLALTAAVIINRTKFGGAILGIPRETFRKFVNGVNVTNVQEKNRQKAKLEDSASKLDSVSSVMMQRIEPTKPLFLGDEGRTTNQMTEPTFALNPISASTTSSPEENYELSSASTPKTILPTTILSSTVHPKKSKMPRVTLKLRENETVPQMYMKAGIASYKKGNITTSVLAHGLSLEGLIFKTPEGTIKPWAPCIPGTHSYLSWANSSQMTKLIHLVLTLLAGITVITLIGLYYVQRKAIKRHRKNIEEAETENSVDDNSTLLNHENDLNDENENDEKE